MNDENAFGVLLSWADVEQEEYTLEPDEFAARIVEFRAAWREALGIFALGDGVTLLELGHAVYLELADGDQKEDPIVWLKLVRARILERGFETAGVVSFGGRWVDESVVPPLPEGITLTASRAPSEPLRRALYADTAAHYDEADAPQGWGVGLYVDTDAIEALGRSLKNAPTPLEIAGATFYRVAR